MGRWLGHTRDGVILKGDTVVLRWGPWLFPRGDRCEYIASLYPRPSVHSEEPHPTRGDTVARSTVELKE